MTFAVYRYRYTVFLFFYDLNQERKKITGKESKEKKRKRNREIKKGEGRYGEEIFPESPRITRQFPLVVFYHYLGLRVVLYPIASSYGCYYIIMFYLEERNTL